MIWSWNKKPAAIEPGLAMSLASQVSAGLARGDNEEQRQRGALVTIGLMLMNATNDEHVQDVLERAGSATVTVEDDVTHVTFHAQ